MYCITGMSHTKKSMFSKDKLQNNDAARPSIKWNPAAEQKCQPLAFGCRKMQVLQYEPCVTIKTPETKDMWTGMSWSDAQRWHTPSPHSSFPATWSNGVTYSSVSAQQRQTRSPVHQGAPRSSDAVWIWRGGLQVIVCGDGARLATGGVTESLFSTWLGFISTLPWARSQWLIFLLCHKALRLCTASNL